MKLSLLLPAPLCHQRTKSLPIFSNCIDETVLREYSQTSDFEIILETVHVRRTSNLKLNRNILQSKLALHCFYSSLCTVLKQPPLCHLSMCGVHSCLAARYLRIIKLRISVIISGGRESKSDFYHVRFFCSCFRLLPFKNIQT